MAKNKLALYATEEFINDFKLLISFNEIELDLFKNTFKKEYKFDFDEELIEKFLVEAKIDISKLSSISAVVKYIHKYVLENVSTPKDIDSELKLLIDKSECNVTENQFKQLVDLFTIPQSVLEDYSDSPYIRSVIPNLVSTLALFDLRAIYKSSDSDEIKSLKPISIIRLLTEDDKDKKKYFSFQTDLEGLNKFIEYLTQYRDKLSQLEALSNQLKK